MSWEFVLSIIFAIVALGLFFYYRSFNDRIRIATAEAADNSYDRDRKNTKLKNLTGVQNSFKSLFRGFLGLSLILLIFASFYTVPVRNIGIVTTFGNPSGATTGSGLHPVWPWQKVADFDASVQTTKHLGDWNQGCTVTRIGSLATACVENVVQWQVTDSGGPKLFKDYKGSFENLSINLVNTKIQNALNKVFATYNPLSQVNIQTGQVDFDGAKLSKDLENQLAAEFDTSIKVISVTVPLVHHDAQTENNIKQFQDVVAQTRILAQKKTNAEVEKTVADLQAQFLTPQYLQNKCIEESVKMGFAPGLCLMDSGIVNAPTTK
jgi:regulator of protease activity HflC (stomatin/prohibitin superfamily)